MPTLFKNIRRKMAQQNRVKNYLLYALGEIFLVVIGILIALRVNNWNENQKQKKREAIYLQDLSIDLKKQIQLQDYYINFEDILMQNCKDITAHYEQNKRFNKMDSIFPEINDLAIRVTFTNANTTLLELINSGDINIIDNESLKKELTEFNQYIQGFNSNTINNNTDLVDQIVVRNVLKNSDFATYAYSKRMRTYLQKRFTMNFIAAKDNTLKSIAIQNLNEPKSRLEVMNNVAFRYGLAELQKVGDEKLKTEAEQLLKDVERELNK